MQEVFKNIIEQLKEYRNDFMENVYEELKDDSDNIRANNIIDGFDSTIDIVKQVAAEYNNGWIPVEERVPNKNEYLKNDGRFIVTDGNRRYQSFYDIYNNDFRTVRHIEGNECDFSIDNCVIAWQPLPEPYKPKGD